MSITLLSLFVIIICLSLITKKKGFLPFISFLMAWLLISGNYENVDYSQYESRYKLGFVVLDDYGFSVLCGLFNSWGFTYSEFKSIISFLCLLLIYRSIRSLCRDSVKVFVFFMLFPFIVSITQFRNFVSYSLVYTAIPFLLYPGRSNLIKYALLVMIAATIHTSSIFYLLFVFSRMNIRRWHIVLGIIFLFIVKGAMKAYFTQASESDKLINSQTTTLLGALYGSFIIILNCALVWFVYNKSKNFAIQDYKSIELPIRYSVEKIWPYCNLILLLLIPFIFDNGNYSRIYRNIAVFNVIFVFNSFYVSKKTKKVLLLIYYGYFVITTYFVGDGFEFIFYPVFAYNSII